MIIQFSFIVFFNNPFPNLLFLKYATSFFMEFIIMINFLMDNIKLI